MRLPRLCLALAFVLAAVASSDAQEWTRFRGPNGTGESETQIPAQWGEKEIAWKIDLPGFGHSSPVLWGDKLFILSADAKSATRYLLCRDDRMFAADWARRHARARLGIDADELDGGHYVSLSRPRELAERLAAYVDG